MSKSRPLVHSFNVGEVSASALARVDQERIRLAAEIQENIFGHVVGKGMMRPGTEYLVTTPSSNQTRLLTFVRDVDTKAVFHLSNENLRVMVDDVLVTRPSVTSTVTNGDMSSGTGWTLTATGSATSAISGGVLTLQCPARGTTALARQQVTTSDANTEHALRIVVTRGGVTFRCGSTEGGDDYITTTTLPPGTFSLSFTPSGSYWVEFFHDEAWPCIVDSITIEAAGIMDLPAPWVTAELREIRTDQSIDVMYLAHDNWHPRQIQRRSDTSWGVCLYETSDGPFAVAGIEDVKLTLGASYGSTTLTADRAAFKSTDVGRLIYMFTPGHSVPFALGAADTYTDVIRVSGIGADNDFTIVIAGTWVGTLVLQRSYDGEDSGFIDVAGYSWTGNTSGAFTASADFDNVIHYYRIGFKPAGFTSGTANVTITYKGSGKRSIVRVSGFTSATVVDCDILESPSSLDPTGNWRFGAWSARSLWPSAVTLYDGRLFWAGRDQLWGSVSDSYTSFDEDVEGDSGPILRNIATGGGVKSANWFLPLQRLLVGTTLGEVSLRSDSFDQPLTATLTAKDASTQGSAKVSPAKVDSRGLFVQRSGRRIYEVYFDMESNDYQSRDLTRMNDSIMDADETLDEGIVELAVQRQPETYIWHVRSDGQVVILLYDLQDKVAGFFRVITDGEIESVAVLPNDQQDDAYLAVKRTINGSTVRYIEKLCKMREARGRAVTKLGDSGVFAAGPVSSVTAAHLANETGLVGWGTASGIPRPLTGLSANGSGVIALGNTYTDVWVGLPYTGKYKSARLAYGVQGGTALLAEKNVKQVGLLAKDLMLDSIKVGDSFDELYPMPRTKGSKAATATDVYAIYQEQPVPFNGRWDTDSRVCLTIQPGYPATLLGLVIDMDTKA